MTPTQTSNREKWKQALSTAVMGLFIISFLSIVIFMFEPPNWLTGLLCLGNILWLSALPIMLVALLANAPFPNRDQFTQTKKPTKIEDLLVDEHWPVEWQESQRKSEDPVALDSNAPTWMILLLALIILIMVGLVFIVLSSTG